MRMFGLPPAIAAQDLWSKGRRRLTIRQGQTDIREKQNNDDKHVSGLRKALQNRP